MKLNNKGYMLVEIIVASVIALVMAYFLIDITIRLVNKNNDYYIESVLLTDKNLVTKEIMEDINDNSNNDILLTSINVTNSGDNIVTAELSFNNRTSKDLIIDKSSNIIKYGNYEKKISSDLSIKEFSISKDSTQKQLYIRIPAYTNYSDIDYGISLVIPYIEDIEVILPEIKKEQVCNPGTGGIPSCPDLAEGLIPVMYYNNNWVKADISNSDETYKWYDYDNKMWANAVLVTETNRDKYLNADFGTLLTETDILAFYVWIPRYKYKVWNINKVIGTDSYSARTKGIDIVFENGIESTGTIKCTYLYTSPSSSAGSPNESCTGSNGDYYTHPAFTFGGVNVKGFWMGKFELSSSSPRSNSGRGGGYTTGLTPRILPNVNSWHRNSLKNFDTVLKDMTKEGNIYGLASSTEVDSHIITNYEWGAVAYLANSKYGRCTNNSCSKVEMNGYGVVVGGEYTNTLTGCGPISSGSTSVGTTCNAYNTTIGMTASTTGNITGVYDMSGGACEDVMANMSSTSGSYTFYPSGSGFEDAWYNENNKKYLVTYAHGTTNRDQAAFNRGRLGDATSEVVLTANSTTGGWYSTAIQIPWDSQDQIKWSWYTRGGTVQSESGSGIFNGTRLNGSGWLDTTTRAILVFLK